MSEGLSGLSLQYDTSPRRVSGTADTAMIQKWRIHFAKPPSSATAVALPKPVATATLVQNLELDEDAVSVFCARHLDIPDLVVVCLITVDHRDVLSRGEFS